MAHRFVDIDDYARTFSDEVRTRLEQVRQTIHQAVPGAGEKISYQIPTITLNGSSLVHFAGWKHHVSLYRCPRATTP
ncbi:MAG: iron chaperone [Nocardioides sp.]